MELRALVLRVGELLKEKRAENIVVLDLDGITSIADYFVLCTVKSGVQARALVRFLDELMKPSGIESMTRNPGFESMWVLLDYNFFIVHIFLKEGRDYYQLEKLWCDAKVLYSHEGEFL